MSKTWNCLFLHSKDASAVTKLLQHSLTVLGYTLYNPFGVVPGKAYAHSVRLFVAPAENEWVRVIGKPDEKQFTTLSRKVFLLYTALEDHNADLRTYANGDSVEPISALTPFLRASLTSNHLQQALQITSNIIHDQSTQNSLPLNALPGNVQSMAETVNTHQAQKMFARLSADLMKKVSKGDNEAQAARELVSGSGSVDWNSTGGLRITSLMQSLTIPETWREPDFDTLRDAYQLHERRRRNPNARVYPGDKDVMAQVPDALHYTPVYGGAN